MRRLSVLVGIVLLVGGCGDSEEPAAAADGAGDVEAYLQALEGWSLDTFNRMEQVERGEPSSDDSEEHAAYRQSRVDAMRTLLADLKSLEPAVETEGAHLELIAGMEDAIEVGEKIIDALQSASSASEVLNGPLSGEVEVASGRVLGPCMQLLDLARELGIQVELFCGSTAE